MNQQDDTVDYCRITMYEIAVITNASHFIDQFDSNYPFKKGGRRWDLTIDSEGDFWWKSQSHGLYS